MLSLEVDTNMFTFCDHLAVNKICVQKSVIIADLTDLLMGLVFSQSTGGALTMCWSGNQLTSY